MNQSIVSVSIVNWNGGETILRCLETLYGQDYAGSTEVFMVDNASSDDSLAEVEKKYPAIKVIRNDSNLGFCKAHNQAIRLARGEFVLVLNFDILLERNFLSVMAQELSRDASLGMASGKLYRLLDGQKTNVIDSTGMTMHRYFSSPRGQGAVDQGQFDSPEQRSIFGPCGAAALYRKAMLDDIVYQGEYFDEGFINYVEDVDLAWRAQLRGWNAVYIPDAVAYHERGITRKGNDEAFYRYYREGFRNRYLAMYKNITAHDWKKFGAKILFSECFFLIGRSDGYNRRRVRWKALSDFFKVKNRFRDKHYFIQTRLKRAPEEMLHFFEYEKSRFLRLLIDYPRVCLHGFLCQFRIGQILIRRYRMFKEWILNLCK